MVDTLLTLLQVSSDRKRESLGRARPQEAAARAMSVPQKETIDQVSCPVWERAAGREWTSRGVPTCSSHHPLGVGLSSRLQILNASPSDAAKAVVWAHNSHLGDARATQRQDRHEWNIGQLVRERLGLAACFNGTKAGRD